MAEDSRGVVGRLSNKVQWTSWRQLGTVRFGALFVAKNTWAQ